MGQCAFYLHSLINFDKLDYKYLVIDSEFQINQLGYNKVFYLLSGTLLSVEMLCTKHLAQRIKGYRRSTMKKTILKFLQSIRTDD